MITSAEEFIRLRDSEKQEEYFRASNEEATDEIWLDIIQRFPDKRYWVAHNKTVKGRILEILANDQDTRIRSKVADRRAAGEKLLSQLALDLEETVRLSVLRNPKVTKNVLNILAKDKSDYVREEAEEKLAELEVYILNER